MAEGARLESVYTGNRIVGSNPTPSATPKREELESNFLRLCAACCGYEWYPAFDAEYPVWASTVSASVGRGSDAPD